MWYDSLKIGTERKVNGWYLTDSWLQLEQVTWEDKSGSKHKLIEMHLRNDRCARRARERSPAKQSKYPRNFGSHVTVRPSVRPHHKASDVKCHTLCLLWEPATWYCTSMFWSIDTHWPVSHDCIAVSGVDTSRWRVFLCYPLISYYFSANRRLNSRWISLQYR